MQDKLKLDLLALDAQYEQITGRCAFLYELQEDGAGAPGAFHFTGGRVIYGVRSALAHMRWLIRQAAEEMEESA